MRATAVVAVAIAVGFIIWLLVRGGDDSSSSPTATSATSTIRTQPLLRGVTRPGLAAFARRTGQPIYWVGPRRGVTYELTRTADGKVFVRYLPKGVRLGNRTGQYLLVGTYPVTAAYQAVQRAAKESGAHAFRVSGGGLAVVNDSAPRNVYFALPRSNYQVEVFDPSGQRARRLVASGAVRRVR